MERLAVLEEKMDSMSLKIEALNNNWMKWVEADTAYKIALTSTQEQAKAQTEKLIHIEDEVRANSNKIQALNNKYAQLQGAGILISFVVLVLGAITSTITIFTTFN